ncbi:hypothetical protein [Streptomyces sp. NPDC101455]|uniref:hypothetical protein n=1 Tax=Streptomyces sp. NPDC101455 TaxID=3366142 RepID=UPI00381BA062
MAAIETAVRMGGPMPSFQFCLYEVSVRQFMKKDKRRLVAEFNSRKHDLFGALQDFMNDGLGPRGVSLKKSEHYIRLKNIEDTSRILWPTVETGRFGNTGIVVATDTGDNAFDIKSTDAPTYPLRQCFIVPRSGESAIWATEVIGQSTAITSLWTPFSDWFKEKYDVDRIVVDRESLQSTNAWNAFIDESELQEISFLVHVKDSDSSVGVRTQEYKAKSGRGTRLPKGWIQRAYARELPPSAVFTATGIPDPDEVHLNIERDGKNRTVVVGRDFPRFMYQIDTPDGLRPSDAIFQQEVLSEVGASLDLMGVSRGDWQA